MHNVHMYVCVCACITHRMLLYCADTRAHLNILCVMCVYARVPVYVHAYVCYVCICMRACARACTCVMCIYTHRHAHMHVYAYACSTYAKSTSIRCCADAYIFKYACVCVGVCLYVRTCLSTGGIYGCISECHGNILSMQVVRLLGSIPTFT